MIGYLRGRVHGRVVLTESGVGYVVHTADPLPGGEEVELHVTTVVREDSITLYGFPREVDQEMFGLLVKVPGVGPQLALSLLHDLGAVTVVRAVVSSDAATLARARGLGRKKAEAICLALKDLPPSLGTLAAEEGSEGVHGALEQLVDTLESLGYDRAHALEAVQSVQTSSPDASESELLRGALMHLRGGGS